MDILLFPTGDEQIGSTTSLHPNVRLSNGTYKPLTDLGGWHYNDKPNFYPSSLQVKIWDHYNKCLYEVLRQRIGKKLFYLRMGDAIDGDHHDTSQLVTRHIHEQVNTSIELANYTKTLLDFQQGDIIAQLQGTEVHVGIEEQEIGRQIGAMEFQPGIYAAPFLEIELNGVYIWAYHKGVSAGQGQTRGNSCITKLRQVYYECLQNGEPIPDMIISAHTHDQHVATWTRPDGKTMYYMITASWQDKTRFVYDNLATNKNKVGAQTVTITSAGEIIVHPPMLLPSPRGESIKVRS